MGQTDGRRRRQHKTRTSVRVAESTSRWVITCGGIGTIVAVCGVFVFLVWTVLDLFRPAEVSAASNLIETPKAASPASIAVGTDEYGLVGWRITDAGELVLVRMFDDSLIEQRSLTGGERPVALGRSADGRDLLLALADHSTVLVTVGFDTEFREADDVPSSLRELDVGEAGRTDDGVAQRTPLGQFRIQHPDVSVEPAPTLAEGDGKLTSVHVAAGNDCLVIAGVTDDRRAFVRRREVSTGIFDSGEPEWKELHEVELAAEPAAPALACALTDFGTNLSLVWESGELHRYNVRSPAKAELAETHDIGGERGAGISCLDVLLGGSTLLVGYDTGGFSAWFVHPDAANEVDGTSLAMSREFEPATKAPITCFGNSSRMRMFLVGDAAGVIRSYYMTSGKLLAELRTGESEAIRAVSFAPKSDAVLAATDEQTWRWGFEPKHADASLSALFGKVWYERYEEPTYEWQSSSADDASEPKISLVPLVFGTLKATFYSMLIGLPLAILAAIYTSEFMRGKLRATIKPTVEMMASLPSVVLGFLGAVVLAPIVEAQLTTVLALFVTIPFSILLGAHIGQTLPSTWRWQLDRLRLAWNLFATVVGMALASPVGLLIEQVVFAGDVRGWLDGRVGGATPGWMILMLPIAVLLVTLAITLYVNPWLRRIGESWSAQRAGVMHLAKFLTASAAVVIVAFGLAAVMPGDVRGGVEIGAVDLSPIQSFDPRNALVVGFMMGFAIIPIMYTIAEDALSSVPSHLRAAALGAGATSWQTAWRVVVPTAMSGLFSASMVGLGRAVGETMIVLMAAGNTALLSMNVFNGFRTLSANIATELPEAVRDSTHYKTLFLAALVLFAMTFVINTVAESVRLRFRRRAFQL